MEYKKWGMRFLIGFGMSLATDALTGSAISYALLPIVVYVEWKIETLSKIDRANIELLAERLEKRR